MFLAIEKALVQSKVYVPPSIYIKSDVDKNLAAKLKEIVRKRSGQAVDNEESATHVLYPHCDPLEEEYARPGKVDCLILFDIGLRLLSPIVWQKVKLNF